MVVVTVFLEKVSDLKDTDGAMNHPDPYVVFTVKKDNFGPFDKEFGKHTSTKKQGTCNPEYGETFVFKDVPSMEKLTLHAKVWDQDIGLDDGLGHTSINLEKELTKHGEFKAFEEKLSWSGKGMIKKAVTGTPTIFLKIKYEE